MIQTLNPYSSKTDEIMSRYRPIAPKPELPLNNANSNSYDNATLVPEKFRQSPYLRNIWSHLQARPTRTRKRGRTSGISPSAAAMMRKEQEQKMAAANPTAAAIMGLCTPPSARNISFSAFGVCNDHNRLGQAVESNSSAVSMVTLPLLSCPISGMSRVSMSAGGDSKAIDLNAVAAEGGLEERDLLLQLQVPSSSSSSNSSCVTNVSGNGVISPRPVRPVGSSIRVMGPITEDPTAQVVVKRPEEVEEEAEKEALPVVFSDSNNKVRMSNAAYKELVGQPECTWLESMVSSGRRIGGEVMLFLSSELGAIPSLGNGFSCWVHIEWESDGAKNMVNAFCDVARLACESKDYQFQWRFHTREVSPSGSKV